MPELPEVEVIRAQLTGALTGAHVIRAWGHDSPKYATAAHAAGATLGEPRRRGKYLLIDLHPTPTPEHHDGGTGRAGAEETSTDRPGAPRELIIHLGMTGVLTHHPGTPVQRARHTVAEWHLDDGTALTLTDPRRFGRAVVVTAGDHHALPTLAQLGTDPLDPAFTVDELTRALHGRRGAIKAVLLSQRAVAGIGNWSADESLWRARIHPTRPAGTLDHDAVAALHAAIGAVLTEGIAHGGTTLRDYRSMDGTGSHQDHLDVYGRAGQPCRACTTTLQAATVAGRGTTWCPHCQAG